MSSKRSVLHIVPSAPWGGIQALVPMLAREQVRQGLVVEVICLGRGTRIRSLAAEYGLASRILFGPFAPLRLALLLGTRKAIVHSHCEPVWASAVIAVAAPRRWVEHAHVYPDGPADWKARLSHWLQRHFARRHIAISHSVGRAMRASGIASDATLDVVHNGVAVDAGLPVARATTDRFTIGFVGRVVAEKGIFDFIALVGVLAHDARLAFAVYGDGADLDDARALAAKRGVADRIVFHGHVEDIASAWANIHVAVILSHREPFGLVFLEAALRGVPTISYDTDSGGSEVAVTLASAHRIAPQDFAALAAIVQALAADPAASAEALEHDRVTIAARYAIAAMARGVAASYERLDTAVAVRH